MAAPQFPAMRKAILFPFAILLLLISIGCASLTPHPNQINAFDGATYDILITVQASIAQAKTLINQFPQFTSELNKAIASYNTAIADYKLYHEAAASAPTQTTLQTQITSLVTAVSQLLSDLGVKIASGAHAPTLEAITQ